MPSESEMAGEELDGSRTCMEDIEREGALPRFISVFYHLFSYSFSR